MKTFHSVVRQAPRWVLFAALFVPLAAFAGDLATFASFYKPGALLNWWWLAIGALVSGAVILFTGGLGGPVVAGVGTWIGGS